MEALPIVSSSPVPNTTVSPILNLVSGVFEIGFLVFGVVYFLFTLILLRQVSLMTSTVKTEGGGILKALAILYAGLALGVIVLFIGLF